MKYLIICIIIYAMQFNMLSYAMGIELSDTIKQARDIEMQKNLAVKNTVKEMKNNINQQELPATETINPSALTQKTQEKSAEKDK